MRNATPAPHDRNQDIEVLRAVAVLLTIACHLGNLLRWSGAWSESLSGLRFWGGVDLFFCISGFVITSSLLRLPASQTFADLAGPFYIRRIFRIWPAALLWLLLPLLAAHFFNSSGAFGLFREDLPDSAAAAGQVANIYAMVCAKGAALHWPCGKAEVYWSLSLEEQFYLVFPFLLYFLSRKALMRVLIGLILVQIFLNRPVETPLWYVRTDAIAFGVLLALAHADGHLARIIRPAEGRTKLIVLAVLLIVAVAVLAPAQWLRINVGLLAVASAGLVAIASFNADVILPIASWRAALLWVGSRSYAIYLVHNPCFWATRELFHRLYPNAVLNDAFTLPFLLTGLGLIALSSELTFRSVETPLRIWGRRLASRVEARRIPPPAIPAIVPPMSAAQ